MLMATPGRLLDFCDEGTLDLSSVNYLILDEADRMLDMGFERDVRRIVGMTSSDRQTLMFSATWPQEIRKIAHEFFTDPLRIIVGSGSLQASASVTQNVEVVDPRKRIGSSERCSKSTSTAITVSSCLRCTKKRPRD